MSNPEPSAASAPAWPVLGLHERRVLGVLVEKAKTTPDAYPMSLNALVTGCNQKSNRDPVLNLSDDDVETALAAMQQQLLTIKITGGGRVERWRHGLYEAWKVNKVELAVLGELLLRGPQTEGELRGRASRMEPIDGLETLRTVLRVLAQRGLTVYLTPEGRRGTTLTHGFHAPDELERLRAKHGSDAGGALAEEPSASATLTSSALPMAEMRGEIESLRAQVQNLQRQVGELAAELNTLKSSLGA